VSNFVSDYISACHTFNVNDVATRRNIEQYIAPRLQKLRKEMTVALWNQRKSSFPFSRKDRQVLLKEARRYAVAVRTACSRIRNFEKAQDIYCSDHNGY